MIEVMNIIPLASVGTIQSIKGTVRSVKRKKMKEKPIKKCNSLVCMNATNIYCENSEDGEYSSIYLPSSEWNISGWIRIYCGPYRDCIDYEEPSRMVHVMSTATTQDIIREMDLPMEYTIWVNNNKLISIPSFPI